MGRKRRQDGASLRVNSGWAVKVLFLTQYFPPEIGAPQSRLAAWALHLERSGHEVTVLTAFPNYPAGAVYEGYRGHLAMQERWHNLRVIRTWIYASSNKAFWARLVSYFSFVFSSLVLGLPRLRRQDVVVVESPPLFLAFSGLVISFFCRSRFAFNVSDLWPESAVVLGVVRNKVAIKLAYWFEGFVYRHADLITGQTRGIVNSIRSRFSLDCVAFVPNGVDLGRLAPETAKEEVLELRHAWGLEGRFVVGYAGLHGLAQDLTTALEAARELSQHQGVVLVFVGDGPEKAQLVERKREWQLDNVRFLPPQPRERMREVWSLFDVALVPLKNLDLFKGAMPSKMFEAMAMGIPLIAALDGEARRLLQDARTGVCVDPGDPHALAEAVLRLYGEADTRKRFADNGRKYVVEHHDQSALAEKFKKALWEVHCGGFRSSD